MQSWQAIKSRCSSALGKIRGTVTARRVRRGIALAFVVGVLAIGLEAVIRGHLVAPEARMPTALYTRPVSWGDGDRGAAVPIGTIDGGTREERIPTRLGDFPDELVEAVLAIEDQRFYQHHGLDLRRIAGAMVANVRAGGIAEGGSTLTQQLAKNLFLSARRSPLRKLREAALAVMLELRYDKSTILEAYLNEIYLGQDGAQAIHGMAAAARYYFGRDVDNLSLDQAALLAGMISAPNRLAPTRHPEAARARRDLVLSLMAEQGRVSERAAQRASRRAVHVRAHPMGTVDARYFRDLVRTATSRGLPSRGAAVYTTLDAGLQRDAERAVSRGMARLGRQGAQAALVAIDPRNGDVLAMVGGRDYGASQFNRATEARRQPGSAFKPVVALAALSRDGDHDPDYTLASVIEDEPLTVDTRSGPWQPVNYDHEFRGPVTLREALEQSLNVPFARVGLEVGPQRIVRTAHRLGIGGDLRAVPSLALGSSEVTLLDLVRAYGVLAAGGTLATTRMVLGTRPDGGDRVEAVPVETSEVADPASTFLVTSALEGAVMRGTARGIASSGYRGALAGKTGTSNNWRDAWFVAYTPTLAVGVWVGYDDGRSLHATGAIAALPIVAAFLGEVPRADRHSEFAMPDGVQLASVGSGGDSWFDACGSREYFLDGTAPPTGDCFHFEGPDGGNLGDEWRDNVQDWRRELQREARRFLRELMKEHGVEISIGR